MIQTCVYVFVGGIFLDSCVHDIDLRVCVFVGGIYLESCVHDIDLCLCVYRRDIPGQLCA